MLKRETLLRLSSLIGVFFIFTFLRFFNLINRIGFAWDQEQFSYQVYDIIVKHKFTLLGPRVVSDSGFFLAPYFTYILVPFYALTRLDPVALYYFVIAVNILFFFLGFFIVKRLYNFQTAIFFLLFWAVNAIFVRLDVAPWWPIMLPTGILLTWFLLKKIYDNGHIHYWIALGLTLGFFMNMHFQFIFVILFSIVFLLIRLMSGKIKKKSLLNPLSSGLAFAALFLPLVFFDLRHQFLNVKLFFSFFGGSFKSGTADLVVWQTVFGNYLKPFLGIQNQLTTIAFYSFIVVCLIVLIRKKKDFNRVFYQAGLFLWTLFPIFFMAYGKRPSEYYFIFLLPMILIVIIDFFYTLKKPVILFVLVAIMAMSNFADIKDAVKSDPFSLVFKQRAVKKIVTAAPFKRLNVSYDVPLGMNNGYGYILASYGVVDQNISELPLIKIRIPPGDGDERVGEIGVFVPKEYAVP